MAAKTKTKQSPELAEELNGSKASSDQPRKPVKGSFYEKSKHIVGSVDSGLGDLSSNKEYLKDFGRSRNADNR